MRYSIAARATRRGDASQMGAVRALAALSRRRAAPAHSSLIRCAAVKGGRFIARGAESDVASVVVPRTTIVDLAGWMAMPGSVDIHNHIMMGGQADLFELRFPSNFTIRKAASEAPAGAWIVGGQFGNDLLARLNTDEASAMLDAASVG